MIIAEIDKDCLNEKWNNEGGEYNNISRAGTGWDEGSIVIPDRADVLHEIRNGEAQKVRFRCKDDDGEIYYKGWLYNDGLGCVQMVVLEWTQRDAGCTTIEVKLDGEWVQEIG